MTFLLFFLVSKKSYVVFITRPKVGRWSRIFENSIFEKMGWCFQPPTRPKNHFNPELEAIGWYICESNQALPMHEWMDMMDPHGILMIPTCYMLHGWKTSCWAGGPHRWGDTYRVGLGAFIPRCHGTFAAHGRQGIPGEMVQKSGIKFTSWGKGSVSHYLQGFKKLIPGSGCLGFLNQLQCHFIGSGYDHFMGT